MGYADHIRGLFPQLELVPADVRLLEPHQIAGLAGRRSERASHGRSSGAPLNRAAKRPAPLRPRTREPLSTGSPFAQATISGNSSGRGRPAWFWETL